MCCTYAVYVSSLLRLDAGLWPYLSKTSEWLLIYGIVCFTAWLKAWGKMGMFTESLSSVIFIGCPLCRIHIIQVMQVHGLSIAAGQWHWWHWWEGIVLWSRVFSEGSSSNVFRLHEITQGPPMNLDRDVCF